MDAYVFTTFPRIRYVRMFTPSWLGATWFNFLKSSLEFRVFLLLDWLPHLDEKPNPPYYWPITGGRNDGFMLLRFPSMETVTPTAPPFAVIYNYIIIFNNPSARAEYDTRSILSGGLNSEISFSLTSCLTKAEEPSLPYCLPIAGGRVIGFIPFPRVLVLCEMPSVSSRIWTFRRVHFLQR